MATNIKILWGQPTSDFFKKNSHTGSEQLMALSSFCDEGIRPPSGTENALLKTHLFQTALKDPSGDAQILSRSGLIPLVVL